MNKFSQILGHFNYSDKVITNTMQIYNDDKFLLFCRFYQIMI
jgi:hypothetical protein